LLKKKESDGHGEKISALHKYIREADA